MPKNLIFSPKELCLHIDLTSIDAITDISHFLKINDIILVSNITESELKCIKSKQTVFLINDLQAIGCLT